MRQTIQGEILGTKYVQFHLGYGKSTSTLKMLVQAEGFKVWVTVPSNIKDNDGVRSKIVDRGEVIRFEVALKATNDPTFFIGSRPNKAEIIQGVK